MRGWRNWQTHYLEVVAAARSWRFESSPAHKNRTRMSFMDILVCVCGEDSNGKGAGETVVSPWRKLLKPLGFRKFCSAKILFESFPRQLLCA